MISRIAEMAKPSGLGPGLGVVIDKDDAQGIFFSPLALAEMG
jgi:hypothetical protein